MARRGLILQITRPVGKNAAAIRADKKNSPPPSCYYARWPFPLVLIVAGLANHVLTCAALLPWTFQPVPFHYFQQPLI
jgi:hypothetical protein